MFVVTKAELIATKLFVVTKVSLLRRTRKVTLTKIHICHDEATGPNKENSSYLT